MEGQPRSWGIDQDVRRLRSGKQRKNNHGDEGQGIAEAFAQGVTMEAEAMSRGRRKAPGKQIFQGQTDEPKAARAVA
jgi:hypothetical protein